MNSKNKKILAASGIFLVALNIFAFYTLQEGIRIAKAISNTQNKEALKSLEQKQILSDVVPSLIFTIDIALLFFLCYLLIKSLIKSLKKSTSNK
ncbi:MULTISPECIES: hypothetical protein [unclassified Kaistella]|uniref:hypothetical protein n=1 Tax=unclassified Kaistella TaxID=2762626 RepID=UPI0027357ADF|nr:MULTISPECIES: hypothetical protein [unclassified Kaistella]MDP2454324.1 hypothetical protein [Kaistella sp. SH11-4b]MDP2457811.1 hypothetical protein [Kaistella sp. SH40-3]MDP2460717.1 hypothetical protein [Kaistella sp. SH19-2b]